MSWIDWYTRSIEATRKSVGSTGSASRRSGIGCGSVHCTAAMPGRRDVVRRVACRSCPKAQSWLVCTRPGSRWKKSGNGSTCRTGLSNACCADTGLLSELEAGQEADAFCAEMDTKSGRHMSVASTIGSLVTTLRTCTSRRFQQHPRTMPISTPMVGTWKSGASVTDRTTRAMNWPDAIGKGERRSVRLISSTLFP